MFYYLFEWIDNTFDIPGTSVFQYISFRTGMSVILSLIISMLIGKWLIEILKRYQVGEEIRELGLQGENSKKGTPTMGGFILILAILIPTLLFAKLHNIYIILILVSTVWLGVIGFIDDYIKVFQKKKKGLAGKFKLFGQIGLGLVVGATLYFHEDVVIRTNNEKLNLQEYPKLITTDKSSPYLLVYNQLGSERKKSLQQYVKIIGSSGYSPQTANLLLTEIGDIYVDPGMLNKETQLVSNKNPYAEAKLSEFDQKSTKTTIPFFKFNEFDYASILSFLGNDYQQWTFLVFLPIVVFIISAVSNGANITDGLDGLATGTSAIVAITLGVFAYVSGHTVFSKYLNIMYIPHIGELVIYIGALIGACIGFLWYNSYPAQVFMGDTGSLTLGGIIAVLAVMVRKELLIPVLCGIFLIENLSVIIQVSYFKYTKKKFGIGKRIFKMSPIHHHYQLSGYHESKIVTRFWIVGIMLAIFSIITLKLR